jgi:hypothetical protein
MDIVIPLASASGDNFELRYALRSIEKYLTGHNRIFIVSDVLPYWAQNVLLIKAQDPHKHNKDANIIDKVRKACTQIMDLSDTFLFWSDDQVLLKPCKCSDITPVYSTLTPAFEPETTWRKRLKNTVDTLAKKNKAGTHWDAHVPQPFNKKLFIEITESVDYAQVPGYAINTLYFNMSDTKPVVQKDTVKCTVEDKMDLFKFHELVREMRWLGYNDMGWTHCVKTYLERVLTKSNFEKEKTEMEIIKMKENHMLSMREINTALKKPYMVMNLMDNILSYLPQLETQFNKILDKTRGWSTEDKSDKVKMNQLCTKLYAEVKTSIRKVIYSN